MRSNSLLADFTEESAPIVDELRRDFIASFLDLDQLRLSQEERSREQMESTQGEIEGELKEEEKPTFRKVSGKIYLTWAGAEKTLTEWAEITGIKRDTLYRRFKRGWTVDDILWRPLGCRKKSISNQELTQVFLEALTTEPLFG